MKNRIDTLHWLGTLIFFNTIILCCCGIPAILTDPVPQVFATHGFYALCYVAQNFLFSCLVGIVLLPVFLLFRSVAIKIIFSIFFIALSQNICFVNAKVFGFWHLYINKTLLHLFFIGGSKVFEVHTTLYVWITFMLLAFLLVSACIVFLSRKYQHFFRMQRWLSLLIFIYIVAQSLFIFFCTQNNMKLLQYTVKIPYFYDLSIANLLEKMGVSIFPKNSLTTKLRMILSEDKKLQYPLHPLNYHSSKHPLNVLLIVVDTLRYDMINPVNMPAVFRFSQHAYQFLDNQSGGDCTRPGIFSLFYSIPATYWDSVKNQHQGAILIRAFQENHYQMGLYASAPLSSPPFDHTVFSTVQNLKLLTSGKTAIERDAKITVEMQHFLDRSAKNHKPFFGFMFYDAPHAYNSLTLHMPFHPMGYLNYFDIHNDTPVTPIFNLYKNSVYADDQFIKKILLTLQQNNLNKNTVVIITADHGQEYNEYHNDYWEHTSGFSKYQMRTPMIIAWPGLKPKLIHDQTTHFDLAPTLLKRVLGVTNPSSDYSVGDDLFSKKQLHSFLAANYSYFALVSHDHAIIFYDSGLYRETNLEMKPFPDAKILPSDFSTAIDEMTRFYSESQVSPQSPERQRVENQ